VPLRAKGRQSEVYTVKKKTICNPRETLKYLGERRENLLPWERGQSENTPEAKESHDSREEWPWQLSGGSSLTIRKFWGKKTWKREAEWGEKWLENTNRLGKKRGKSEALGHGRKQSTFSEERRWRG